MRHTSSPLRYRASLRRSARCRPPAGLSPADSSGITPVLGLREEVARIGRAPLRCSSPSLASKPPRSLQSPPIVADRLHAAPRSNVLTYKILHPAARATTCLLFVHPHLPFPEPASSPRCSGGNVTSAYHCAGAAMRVRREVALGGLAWREGAAGNEGPRRETGEVRTWRQRLRVCFRNAVRSEMCRLI